MYVHDEYASVTRPLKVLKAFRRISLKAGETKTVDFTITPPMLSIWSSCGRWETEPGEFKIFVGSSSADKDLIALHLTVK
jgi:beta-glucosidase